MWLYLLIAAAVAVLDQLVKHWAAASLQPVHSIDLIPGIFRFTYTENSGMAFSMFSDRTDLLTLVSLVAVILMLVALYRRWLPQPLSMVALSLVTGGAVGNMIDRALLGYVIDLFDFYLIDYAIFNVADSFINIGAWLLVLDALLQLYRDEKAKRILAGRITPRTGTDGYQNTPFHSEIPGLEDAGRSDNANG